jgi:hypothetical protein
VESYEDPQGMGESVEGIRVTKYDKWKGLAAGHTKLNVATHQRGGHLREHILHILGSRGLILWAIK